RLREVQVRRVDELRALAAQRGDDVGVGVPEEVDRDARDEVEVFAAGVVVHHAAPATHEGDGQAATGLHEVALGEVGRVHDQHRPRLAGKSPNWCRTTATLGEKLRKWRVLTA